MLGYDLKEVTCSAEDPTKQLSVNKRTSPTMPLVTNTNCALSYKNLHERARQPCLAKGQELLGCWVRKFEVIVDDEVRENHLHDNGYVKACRALGM